MCLQSHGFRSWGPEVEEHMWVGTSPASALSTPCWKAQLLQPRLASLFLPHFLPLTPTQAKAWYSKEDISYTPTFSLSFPAPQAVFWASPPTVLQPHSVCSQQLDQFSTYPSLLAGRIIHFSHVTTPATTGSQLLCLGHLNSNSMQKLGNCLLVLNTKSLKREYYWSKLCQLSISGPTTCGHRVGKEVTWYKPGAQDHSCRWESTGVGGSSNKNMTFDLSRDCKLSALHREWLLPAVEAPQHTHSICTRLWLYPQMFQNVIMSPYKTTFI